MTAKCTVRGCDVAVRAVTSAEAAAFFHWHYRTAHPDLYAADLQAAIARRPANGWPT